MHQKQLLLLPIGDCWSAARGCHTYLAVAQAFGLGLEELTGPGLARDRPAIGVKDEIA